MDDFDRVSPQAVFCSACIRAFVSGGGGGGEDRWRSVPVANEIVLYYRSRLYSLLMSVFWVGGWFTGPSHVILVNDNDIIFDFNGGLNYRTLDSFAAVAAGRLLLALAHADDDHRVD